MTIPEGLPTLAMGNHEPEEGRACVMELVSVLAGERWTDWPTCTNRFLTSIAQEVNDYMGDGVRRDLLKIVPLLIGTRAASRELELELDARLRLRFRELRDEWRTQNHPHSSWSSRLLHKFSSERGVEVLRELAQMCDEFNGYDRNAQEPQPVVETLVKIHERAGVS